MSNTAPAPVAVTITTHTSGNTRPRYQTIASTTVERPAAVTTRAEARELARTHGTPGKGHAVTVHGGGYSFHFTASEVKPRPAAPVVEEAPERRPADLPRELGCYSMSLTSGRVCTLAFDHDGDHVAHGPHGVVEVWERAANDRTASEHEAAGLAPIVPTKGPRECDNADTEHPGFPCNHPTRDEAEGRAQARTLFGEAVAAGTLAPSYLRAELDRTLDLAERDRLGFTDYRRGYLSELVELIAEAAAR